MVTQDTSLLHRSVRDNIRYGQPEATRGGDRGGGARRRRPTSFIAGLEDCRGRDGYDAHVGERGVKLSGGQRQRVAIARLILKDAPILVLDEATSALDSEVEAAIQEQLYGLMEGSTVIAIAHRLSTIAVLDRLVVMDEGADRRGRARTQRAPRAATASTPRSGAASRAASSASRMSRSGRRRSSFRWSPLQSENCIFIYLYVINKRSYNLDLCNGCRGDICRETTAGCGHIVRN